MESQAGSLFPEYSFGHESGKGVPNNVYIALWGNWQKFKEFSQPKHHINQIPYHFQALIV